MEKLHKDLTYFDEAKTDSALNKNVGHRNKLISNL
jgi:hypothetical protein